MRRPLHGSMTGATSGVSTGASGIPTTPLGKSLRDGCCMSFPTSSRIPEDALSSGSENARGLLARPPHANPKPIVQTTYLNDWLLLEARNLGRAIAPKHEPAGDAFKLFVHPSRAHFTETPQSNPNTRYARRKTRALCR